MIIENIFFTQDLKRLNPDNMHFFGLLITGNKPVDHIPEFIKKGGWWILDNGAFTKKGFNKSYWEDWLKAMREYNDKCVCVVIPDVVGDCKKTLVRFDKYSLCARKHYDHIAFVTQDGLTCAMTPWEEFDVLFIGGSDRHKMGKEAGYLIQKGLELGKHIHVGRVNTEYRLMQFWQCHTWDGSALTIKPEKYESIIIDGLKAVINKKNQPSLFAF